MTGVDRTRSAAPGADLLAPILLVEDNPADVRLTREAARGAGIVNRINVVTDGDAALAYLQGHPPYATAARPALVLLDLNLPRIDGLQVLRTIKTDPALQSIPVIVLSTSTAPHDLESCYRLHANCYLVKPLRFIDFADAMTAIAFFWLGVVRSPTSSISAGSFTSPSAEGPRELVRP